MKIEFPFPLPLNIIHILNFFIWQIDVHCLFWIETKHWLEKYVGASHRVSQVHSTKYKQDCSAKQTANCAAEVFIKKRGVDDKEKPQG